MFGNPGGPEPTGYSFSASGKDNTSDDYTQSPSRALMQYAAKSYNQKLPVIRKNPFLKHRLSFPNVSRLSTKHIGRMSRFYSKYWFLKS
ncbi:MAG: hypothetical protein AMJ43_11070 [Coxiella sp. DG_40]|nr:MAG: hypothetical protein AMJ43_11070 [Coxiella sp. DG_40]